MCGICGLFGLGDFIDKQRLALMTSSLAHRGPDEVSTFLSEEIGLGFRRLAIVDRTAGHQPFVNETGKVKVIFNGEIYNYKDLSQMLRQKGHRLTQGGDGEVIAHLYEEYGIDFPKYLRGSFAIALWDQSKHRLFLTRDHIGVKPLYIRVNDENTGLAFASELKTLLVGTNRPLIDLIALDQFISYRYVPAPRTIFKQIIKVLPGTIVICKLKANDIVKFSYTFWNLPPVSNSLSFAQSAEKVAAALFDACQIRWPGEVSAGYFLSGGLDSTALVALHNLQQKETARTYSVGFEQPLSCNDYRYFSELSLARQTAQTLCTNHFERKISLSEVEQRLDNILRGMDEPIADPTAIPLYFLAEFAAANGEKVMFSGEGADELFGGYTTYFEPENYRRFNNLPRLLKSVAKQVFPDQAARFARPLSERYFGVGGLLRNDQKTLLYANDLNHELMNMPRYFPALRTLREVEMDEEERMLRFDLTSWLPENTLMKSDKLTMLHGIEVRLPYIDNQLVELGASMPYAYKLRGNDTKAVLRHAVKQYLPATITRRPKNGFPVPIAAWVNNELVTKVKEVLITGSQLSPFIKKEYIEGLSWGKMASREVRLVWALFTLEKFLANIHQEVCYKEKCSKQYSAKVIKKI